MAGYFSKTKRSSGLDFSDRATPSVLDQSLSTKETYLASENQPIHLQRNKTERRRLQGLQRSRPEPTNIPKDQNKDATLTGKWKIWMINEGGRRIFFFVWIFLHLLVGVFGFMNYQMKDDFTNARATFHLGFAIARSAALILHVDAAFILLPVCRGFISILRRTPLNDIIPFDHSITFHKATGWSIVFWTAVHITAHMYNFWKLADSMNTTSQRIVAFLLTNFTTGPGVTGWIMTICLGVMVWFAIEKRRRAHFERFWYSHHLFIVLFINWQLHGMFCMIKPDRPPYCSSNTIGVFWRYWLVGGVIWIGERVLREVRSRHRTYISKVIQHPSKVMEIQIKKEKTTAKAGQYIFLSCPEISYFQWHPFTLTSAPEEDYISVHIRVVGDFTAALAGAVGCDFDSNPAKDAKDAKDVKDPSSKVVIPPLYKVLPRVMVDGPFGTATEDFLKYETVLLVGAGIGVTPFASVLKSIWYRMNNFNSSKSTHLTKVYFTWVIRDFDTAEWFHSLLHAIEEQDTENRIEINIYLTAKIKDDDVNNIIVQDVGAEKDAITSLRAPTHFGRPNWDRVFSSITQNHPETDVGVFYCGPPNLAKILHVKSNEYSTPNGTRFYFGKEHF